MTEELSKLIEEGEEMLSIVEHFVAGVRTKKKSGEFSKSTIEAIDRFMRDNARRSMSWRCRVCNAADGFLCDHMRTALDSSLSDVTRFFGWGDYRYIECMDELQTEMGYLRQGCLEVFGVLDACIEASRRES